MLQVARLAPKLLQEASEPVADYFLSQFNDDGGAADRAGQSDLYYTVFALEGLIALQREGPARVRHYLESFGEGESLDLVHLCCLARCWAAVKQTSPDLAAQINARWDRTSVYHSFLAWGALQDLGHQPDPFPVQDTSLARTTPTTAAAVTLLRQMGVAPPGEAMQWLLDRAHPDGGFSATETAPIPDLLSTATALHALTGQKVAFDHLREPTLDFLDTLWTGHAFCGSWADDEPDCEYTYYALLAMGHLSLA
ncbi:MAG: prenyltransferase/squalene oxidase repeat-containing protein [Acidobacteriota bacterium]|nr:prenyltransferase/squalene oxidase repeat-containing protein [Acidobacteriota bacterium]